MMGPVGGSGGWLSETRTTFVVSNDRYTFYQIHFIKHNLSNTVHQIQFIKYHLSNTICGQIFFNESINESTEYF